MRVYTTDKRKYPPFHPLLLIPLSTADARSDFAHSHAMPSGKDVCFMTNWISLLGLPLSPYRNGARHRQSVPQLGFAVARKALLQARHLYHTFAAG